jgi:hypothetical protein
MYFLLWIELQLSGLHVQAETSEWKETLATVITYTEGARYRALCTQLGDRLAKDAFAAQACWMGIG